MEKRILYMTYDGITDPLGQSQILPYLRGLARKGCKISIISFEKGNRKNFDFIRQDLDKNGISWNPKRYHKRPPVLSTILDLFTLFSAAKKVSKKSKIDIIHCRSYIPMLVGIRLKRILQCGLIFDMRGFWADERLEGRIWNSEVWLFRKIYNYFKRKEKEFLVTSDKIISLTQSGKSEILNWGTVDPHKIQVIPCCVDTDKFSPQVVPAKKEELGLPEDSFIISYLGSLGTWYQLNEMLSLFKTWTGSVHNLYFLFITNGNSETIITNAASLNIDLHKIKVVKSSFDEVPKFLAASDIAIYFIRNTYSKMASSPTKLAELMSMDIPIVTNSGIGDSDAIIKDYSAGVLIHEFTPNNYLDALKEVQRMKNFEGRRGALEYFNLDLGIESYLKVYDDVLLPDFS